MDLSLFFLQRESGAKKLRFEMSELRRRKGSPTKDKKNSSHHTNGNSKSTHSTSKLSTCWYRVASIVFGTVIAVIVGVKYALYVRELHENNLWFSNIGQVEREISFRTEAGLYFSYYKQIVLAPSFFKGVNDLMHDNKTEHLRTINILERFNIYQEVILAALYRILPIEMEYVYFYIDVVFVLHGIYMMALFTSSWVLSGSWLAGLLSSCFYIFNRMDTTRISYTIPLRESFGFPFLFVQIAFINFFLKRDASSLAQRLCLAGIAVSTFFFTLVWQFAQFILLLESMAFFGTYSLGFIPKNKARSLYLIVIGSLISVCILQFINDMILCSLALSFAVASVILLSFQSEISNDSLLIRVFKLLFNITVVLLLAGGISFVVKAVIRVESDEHIFKFVKSKFGYGLGRDFDSLLYLCEGAFQFLPTDVYPRLTTGVVFPCYVTSLTAILFLLAHTVYVNWRKIEDTPEDPNVHFLNSHPEVVYQAIQSVFFGVLAVSTLRFKYLWTPHMCLFAAGIFCNQYFWNTALSKIGFKPLLAKCTGHSVPVLLLGLLLFNRLPQALEELQQLGEFYDPDTVELMNWINENTPPNSSFTGSMQLLAGVKLCTDRHITNHPHYENKFLRERTKQVYQIYAKRSPKEIHRILRQHGTDYIILENSICLTRQNIGCRLVDLLDLDNGHVIDDGQWEEGLKFTDVPRFCKAIKRELKTFRQYFKKVFENRTFYLYKLL
ncbi:protein C-mannosyl-transferase DPY19L3-like isoform X2 [Montipora capricornis]|uniref:protein C-mannosyl-transferase DPY19L3-like isoform X2 n=1 Tax=Montipora capricornis TaxID=246305 RepID=UPI0035F1F851